MAPPKFMFRIVRSFQDPLTRQLIEAVRIEEDILNFKAEYSRCSSVVCTNSGAGVNTNNGGLEDICIESSLEIPDMRKA